jgi:hypothetical protein
MNRGSSGAAATSSQPEWRMHRTLDQKSSGGFAHRRRDASIDGPIFIRPDACTVARISQVPQIGSQSFHRGVCGVDIHACVGHGYG